MDLSSNAEHPELTNSGTIAPAQPGIPVTDVMADGNIKDVGLSLLNSKLNAILSF